MYATTEMGFGRFTQNSGFMRGLKSFPAYEGVKEVIVTENGAAYDDEIQNDKIYDGQIESVYIALKI